MRLLLTLAAIIFVCSAIAGTASGTLTVQGKTSELKHSYAYQVEAGVRNTQRATILIISAKPLPPSLISSDLEAVDLLATGIDAIVIEILPPSVTYRESVPPEPSWYVANPSALPSEFWVQLVTRDVRSGPQLGTVNAGDIQQLTASRAIGRFAGELAFRTKVALESGEARFDVRIDTEVIPFVAEPPPSAADANTAASSEAAKAYLQFLKAAEGGNIGATSSLVTPMLALRLQDRTDWTFTWHSPFDELSDVVVRKATEAGDSAKLLASGKLNGSDASGKIWMQRAGGRWLVQKILWKWDGGIPPPPRPPPPPPRPAH